MNEKLEEESFSKKEEKLLTFWRERSIFEKSLKNREGSSFFSFYDGPPFATGLPHYGHLLAGTMKDTVLRYKTMKGFYVPRTFGWDCHGLPVEQEIEKKFNLSGASSILSFGIDRFNEECRSIVLRYTHEWKKTVERMGRWVDFSSTWKTMDLTFMESVWWVFKQIYDKNLVYEGYKVMPFSAKLGTPLSNFEAGENYKEVDDPSVVIAFEVKSERNTFFLAWTTTPWTLVSNMALAVGSDIEYVKVKAKDKIFILAKSALTRWFKNELFEILEECRGKDLAGITYIPLFSYFEKKKEENAFRVIDAAFVSTEDGTGIVHMAPAFGEMDFYACKEKGIPLVCPVDANGKFTDEIEEYKGLFVKDADASILRRLKEKGALFYQGTLHHRYPFCWRSDTPLIYRAMTTWFVSVEKIKEELLKANDLIHWTPEHLKYGRFGKWLEGARDWAISRNRYWGTPIPVWRSEEGDIKVIGSLSELESLTGTKITDLHRHYIDSLTFTINNKTYKRISEVFDCWFESGSMPYGQNHYPFENKEKMESTFPADFIAEGLDQTRGWFYTLTILSVALFGRPAFKNVVVNGIVLAEDGNKMSKRLKNYPEPEVVINKYGADAIRLYLLHSPVVKGDDIRFSEKGVELILRQILIPLSNAHSFFLTYAHIYHWKKEGFKTKPQALIDRWILSKLNSLILNVEKGMDDYDLSLSVEPFVGFVDEITNWYIRRSRRRFWADEDTQDRREAFETLHHVLITLAKIAAPFIPFISETLFQSLKDNRDQESVHLTDFPQVDEQMRDLALEEGMSNVQLAVSLGHALRKENKIKVRQPLPAMHIVTQNKNVRAFLEDQKHLIAEELNVKQVIFHKEPQEFVKLSIKPNFRTLGKKVGKHIKEVQLFIQELKQEEIQALSLGKSFSLILEGKEFVFTKEDVEISHVANEGWVAMHAGILTIALDTEVSEELWLEGVAREVVNKINTMRREANLDVTDRIVVHIATTEKVKHALYIHNNYVKEEVLALEIHYDPSSASQEWDINGEPAAIAIKKI